MEGRSEQRKESIVPRFPHLRHGDFSRPVTGARSLGVVLHARPSSPLFAHPFQRRPRVQAGSSGPTMAQWPPRWPFGCPTCLLQPHRPHSSQSRLWTGGRRPPRRPSPCSISAPSSRVPRTPRVRTCLPGRAFAGWSRDSPLPPGLLCPTEAPPLATATPSPPEPCPFPAEGLPVCRGRVPTRGPGLESQGRKISVMASFGARRGCQGPPRWG